MTREELINDIMEGLLSKQTGNVFRTKKQAQKALKLCKEAFRKVHEEEK